MPPGATLAVSGVSTWTNPGVTVSGYVAVTAGSRPATVHLPTPTAGSVVQTDVPRLVVREERLRRVEEFMLDDGRPFRRQRNLPLGNRRQQLQQVAAVERPDDPWRGQAAREVDRADAGMRQRAPCPVSRRRSSRRSTERPTHGPPVADPISFIAASPRPSPSAPSNLLALVQARLVGAPVVHGDLHEDVFR